MLSQSFRNLCNRAVRNHCHIHNAFNKTHVPNVSSFIRYFSQDLSMSEEEAPSASDQGLDAMSLLQYGEKQVYLFGMQYESRTPPNMKSMINDFGPDHIIFGLCSDRRKKLQEIMEKSPKSESYPALSGETWIKADPPNSHKHLWKQSKAKQVIQLWGLWYGKEYFDALQQAESNHIECVYADKPMQGIVDQLEHFLNEIEDKQIIRESRKEKLIKKSENIQVRATGRQKANKAVLTKAHNKARAECAKLDKDAVVTLDNVCDMFMDKEFMLEKFPDLFDTMYEQRDQQMFDTLKKSKGDVIFCVCPQIHVEGITQKLLEDEAMVLM